MTKKDLLKRVQTDIDLMINGNEFDVRHLFGMTAWSSYPRTDREQIAIMFSELVSNELKECVEAIDSSADFKQRKYKKISEKAIKEAKNVFPGAPVTVNKGSRGNA